MPPSLLRPATSRVLFWEDPMPVSAPMLTITKQCPVCKEQHRVIVARKAYDAWQSGALIQVAFPDLPKDQREILITGIDDHCWREMFAPKGVKVELSIEDLERIYDTISNEEVAEAFSQLLDFYREHKDDDE